MVMEEKSKGKEILEWVYCVVIAIVIVLLVKTYIGVPTVVKQTSMFPTLKQNERLWLNKWDANWNEMPQRGEIITFEAPTDRFVQASHADLENPVAIYQYNPGILFLSLCIMCLKLGKQVI